MVFGLVCGDCPLEMEAEDNFDPSASASGVAVETSVTKNYQRTVQNVQLILHAAG